MSGILVVINYLNYVRSARVGIGRSEMNSRTGPVGGNQGAGENPLRLGLNDSSSPPVTGALGVIGLSGRALQGGVQCGTKQA